MLEVAVDSPESPSVGPNWLNRGLDWLKDHHRAVLLLGGALQVIVLVSMIVICVMPSVTGETVLLRTVPVDPRDLFRGEYVILGYEFSRIPSEGISEGISGPLRRGGDWQGRTVYVSLVPEDDGRHWRADRFSFEQPSGLSIRGTITGRRIEFGIESYFVQEGDGLKYERAVRDQALFARVAVAPDGKAALTGLVIE